MTTVYSYYCLDIIHMGHILMLKKSKQIAGKSGKLVVGILTDEAIMERKKEPILKFEERFQIASSIKYVNEVVKQTTYSPLTNLKMIKPDVLMESSSHSKLDINEYEKFMHSINGRIITVPYFKKQSSTKIKDLIFERRLN